MGKIKAVIFDLDNTLIDFLKFKRMCCSEAVDAMIDAGLKIPKQKSMEIINDLFTRHGMEDHRIFERFLKRTEGRVDYQKLAHAVNAYRRTRIGLLSPYPRAKWTLIKLKEKGLKLAIVSDAPKIKAWLRLTAMRLDDFFDVVVALEDTGRTKPSRLPFRAALRELKVAPSECLMVGDRPARDMKGARSLGMKTCFAKYGYEGKAPKMKVDYAINSIEELVTLL